MYAEKIKHMSSIVIRKKYQMSTIMMSQYVMNDGNVSK